MHGRKLPSLLGQLAAICFAGSPDKPDWKTFAGDPTARPATSAVQSLTLVIEPDFVAESEGTREFLAHSLTFDIRN